jgi:hypothetical protein
MVRAKALLNIILLVSSNLVFSQEIKTDTIFWEEGEFLVLSRQNGEMIEEKEFREGKLLRHLQKQPSGIYRGESFFGNGQPHYTWFSKKVDNEDLILEYPDSLIPVGQSVEFSEQGDTLTIREYANDPNIQAFQDIGEIPVIVRVDFTYYDNGKLLYRNEYGIANALYSYELSPLGWHREYFQNGQLKQEELYVTPQKKWELNYCSSTSGEPTYPKITKNFFEDGQLNWSLKIADNKIYTEGYYQNGNQWYKGTSSLDYFLERDEYEDYKEFDEDGTYSVENEKYIRTYRGENLIEEIRLSKNGEEIYLHQFWDNGQPKVKLTRTEDEYFNKQGKLYYREEYQEEDLYKDADGKPSAFRTYRDNDRLELSIRNVKGMVTCSPSDKINLSDVIEVGFEEDTLKFFDGKLYETYHYEKTRSDSLYLAYRFNFNTNEGYHCNIWYSDTTITKTKKHPSGFEEKLEYINGQPKEIKKLIDVVDTNLIYEYYYYWDSDSYRYEYRNYQDSIYIYTNDHISGNVWDPTDSVVLSKSYRPPLNKPLIYDNAGVHSYLYTTLEGWGKNEKGEIISHTRVWDEEDRKKNGDKLRYLLKFFYKGILYEENRQYEDSLINIKYTLEGKVKYRSKTITENGYNSGAFTEQYYSVFDQNQSNTSRIKQIIPYAPSQTGTYTGLIYTSDSAYVLVGNSYIFETETNSILYQNPLNLEAAGNSHLLKYQDRLYLLKENAIYDFENDTEYLIPDLKRTMGIIEDYALVYDGSPFVKKVKLASIISNHKLMVIDSIAFEPIRDWKEFYLYDNKKLVEVLNYYDHEIKTLDLESREIVSVSFDDFGIKHFEKAGDIFYAYEEKEYPNLIAGKKIDTITYFDINDSKIKVWPLIEPITFQDGMIRSYPYKDGVRKSTSVTRNKLAIDNEILISTTTYDQYDDYTSCCPEPVDLRDFRNIKVEFKNQKIVYLKNAQDYSYIGLSNELSETEKLISNIRTTDEFYTASKKNDVARFVIEKNRKELIIDLGTGTLVMDSTDNRSNETYWEVKGNKNNKVKIPDADKEISMFFLNGKYDLDTTKISGLFSSDDLISSDKKMFSHNRNYIRIFWNGEQDITQNRIVGISFLDSKPIFYTPDRYYMSGFGAEEFLYFQKGLKTYKFEQFDLKYNRPDIILDRLGYADSSLVEAYHQAYKKRLKKMGFTEDMLEDDFHLPEIEIENFEEMPQLHDQGSIELDLKLKDSKYKLDRINVWVNDVAIYGTDGISLRDKNVQEYQTKLEVFLAKGKNKVQLSVLNQAGAESYKETFELECTAGKDQADLYLITIGESEFQQADFNLTYASKDAQDMASLFEKSKVYKNVHTKTLINEQVTKENVMALKSFIEKADINDEVMIFIAGHGVLDAQLDYYFATYDMDFQQPQERGLAYEELESLLDGIKPLKKTLLIDACHSGEIDKDEVQLAEADNGEEGDVQFRAVGNTATPKLGVQNTSELTKSLFTDLRKGTGATVISSAGGMEFAMEGDEWNNGLFTYCLIKGIQSKAADLNGDKEIWLSEIQQYVSEQVFELSGGRQHPTSRIENQTVDFRVW